MHVDMSYPDSASEGPLSAVRYSVVDSLSTCFDIIHLLSTSDEIKNTRSSYRMRLSTSHTSDSRTCYEPVFFD